MISNIIGHLQHHKGVRLISNIFVVLILIFSVIITAEYAVLCLGRNRIFNDEFKIHAGTGIESKEKGDVVTYKRNAYSYQGGLVNILILGIDGNEDLYSRNSDDGLGQSDAIFLMSIDTVNNMVHLISIPRDTMTMVKLYDDSGNIKSMQTLQIALQYAFGNNVEAGTRYMADSVSTLLYNISIDRVVALNMNAIADINDAFGGVDVIIENDFTDESGEVLEESFVKGNVVHLKGDMARIFIQERDCSIAESAMDRLSRQEQYFDALLPKAESMIKRNPLIALDLYIRLKSGKLIYTDMTLSEIAYILHVFSDCDFNADDVYEIPGRIRQGEQYEEYRVKSDELKELIMNLFYIRIQ